MSFELQAIILHRSNGTRLKIRYDLTTCQTYYRQLIQTKGRTKTNTHVGRNHRVERKKWSAQHRTCAPQKHVLWFLAMSSQWKIRYIKLLFLRRKHQETLGNPSVELFQIGQTMNSNGVREYVLAFTWLTCTRPIEILPRRINQTIILPFCTLSF